MLVNENKEISHPLLVFVLLVITLLTYYFLGFEVSRSEFPMLMTGFTLVFICYIVLAFKTSPAFFRLTLVLAILSRTILIPTFPELSDDYFRFIWDGYLTAQGFNPFDFKPMDYIQHVGESDFFKMDIPKLKLSLVFLSIPSGASIFVCASEHDISTTSILASHFFEVHSGDGRNWKYISDDTNSSTFQNRSTDGVDLCNQSIDHIGIDSQSSF